MKYFIVTLLLLCTLPMDSFGQITWQRHANNPVLPAWSGALDDPSRYRYVYTPSVLAIPSAGTADQASYKMWFSSGALGSSHFALSYAISSNGTDWFLYARNPVLSVGPPGSFDSQWIVAPYVMRIGNEYRLYFTGSDNSHWQMGIATSSDGIKWAKYPG
ncbi:MAG: hypothetical protein AAB393_11755, partial [Bacteroidota bacterium]